MRPLRQAMEDAPPQGVFPGGVLLAARGGRVLARIPAGRTRYDALGEAVTAETRYDLASLTKILSTTVLVMIGVDRKRFSLDDRLKDLWPGPVPADRERVTLARLLGHASGLPAWRPCYETLERIPEAERRAVAARLILEEPLESRPGTRAVYSDLNFILLGLILETAGGKRQDTLFDESVAGPLGLERTGYRPLEIRDNGPAAGIAPTEVVERRGGLVHGRVHDDNAWALGGVAGHAGLFGTVDEVWRIFNALRAAFQGRPGNHIVSPETVRLFWKPSCLAPESTWALGFDTPSRTGSSAGSAFSRSSVGHLGYTGCSLWYDPDRDLTAILLTNRVHPTATNEAIRLFRPRIHDLVARQADADEHPRVSRQ